MKVILVADLHGNLPAVPECDLLLIAGDVCPDGLPIEQLGWLNTKFRRWLEEVPAKYVVGIAGNHDYIFEHPDAIRRMEHDQKFKGTGPLRWTYLQDSAIEINGIKIWGFPWVPKLPAWAFYQSRQGLSEKCNLIPKDVDIVLCHGPPYGYGDKVKGISLGLGSIDDHAGCKPLTNMLERVRPKLLVCGHIHEAYGYYKCGDTEIYNVSYVDETYAPRLKVVEIEL